MKEPNIATPEDLFSSDSRYIAPTYQRLYVWGRRELDAFFEDIEQSESGNEQFLGAVVLKDMGKPRGPASPNHFLIIDGQQRLTTIYLVFAAVARVAREHNYDEIANLICEKYLADAHSTKFKGLPKLVPTVQDREWMWVKVLQGSLPTMAWNFDEDRSDGKLHLHSKLAGQWRDVRDRIESLFVASKGTLKRTQLDRFLQKLQSHLQLICITLEDRDDPNWSCPVSVDT